MYTTTYSLLVGRGAASFKERDIEAVLMPPKHEESGIKMVKMASNSRRSEVGTIYIAQCPTPEPRPVQRIEQECKTNLSHVSREIYNKVQLGRHIDFKQLK
jgi:hypothetical protein